MHPLSATSAIAPRGFTAGGWGAGAGRGSGQTVRQEPGDLQAVPCRDEAAILGRLLMR